MTHVSVRAMLIALLLIATALPAAVEGAQPQLGTQGDHRNHKSRTPIVIGHRGASGYRSEHTLGAYRLAIRQGADYIEPDLVSTSDGVLVARHENEIGQTTDVASHSEFASRRTTKEIDGASITGWFTEDFTLAELKTLRAVERIPQLRPQNADYNGRFEIPTLQEVIDLVKHASRRHGPIGIYPETKHPSYFDSIGLSLEEPLVRTLHRNGYRGRHARVFIQSFEVGNLQDLDGMTRVPLVQLLNASGRPWDFAVANDPRTYTDLATPEGLEFIASYADGVGANKDLIIPRDSAGNLASPTRLVRWAHRENLIVHAWTFRAENSFLPTDMRLGDPAAPDFLAQFGDWGAEYAAFFATRLDGLFADQPDLAVDARADIDD
jgi:glycerophosphoryl diester phosphodiesterase